MNVGLKKIGFLIAALLTVSFLTFISHSVYTKTSIFADAKFYYSYTRSLIFDHDLQLGNELYALGVTDKFPTNQFAPIFYPPGVSLLWIALFNLTYGFLTFIKILIPSISINGYELIFEYSCALTNIMLGVFGIYLVYKILTKYFSESVSILSTAAFFLTTNLFFYIAVEPISSHAASFFASALFVFYFLNY